MPLRDVREDDLPLFFEHQRDPDANRMAAFPPRDREAFMLHWRTRILGDPRVNKQTIISGNVVAGHIVGFDLNGQRLVGYWIARAHWGRGLATSALLAFLGEHERQRHIYAHVAVENVGSVRVLEKCGFAPNGPATTGDDGVAELAMLLGPLTAP